MGKGITRATARAALIAGTLISSSALGASRQAQLQDKWTDCLSAQGSLFARSAEPTETAADAALGACKEEETAWASETHRTPILERLLAGPRSGDAEFVAQQDARYDRFIADIRANMIAKIAAKRIELQMTGGHRGAGGGVHGGDGR